MLPKADARCWTEAPQLHKRQNMDIRTLTPRYSVSPQISTSDAAAIAAAGFTTVICNRPDEEVPKDQQAEAIGAAIRAAGLEFHVLPVGHQGMTGELVTTQRDLVESSAGPVLAYCNSGTRSTFVWALGQAGNMPADEIMKTAANAGYNVNQLAPYLG